MATITSRKRADGTWAHRAEIRYKENGIVVAKESKTFDKKQLAKDWAKRREIEWQETGVYGKKKSLTLKAMVEQYQNEYPSKGETKVKELKALLKQPIMDEDIYKLTSKTIIDHVRKRMETCKPTTAMRDLIWIHSIAKTMRAIANHSYELRALEDAKEALKRERITATTARRERRPTRQELIKLSRYLSKPLRHIMWFAIFSCRRQHEITTLEWADLDHKKRTILVRNLKHPKEKGVCKRAKLPRSAYKLIMRQPQIGARIFNYNSKVVGRTFTEACKALGIEDLHFHDLRHHGVSNLFERGLSIVEVQQVSLHTTWETLRRYTNLDPGDVDV